MQSVDALAVKAEEGRFKSAKVIGEVTRTYDPVVSEWGNLARFIWLLRDVSRVSGTWGTEISKYPKEKKSNESPLVSDERTGVSLNRQFIDGVAGPNIT
ncbi:hypothetical protein A3K29_00005 [Candidatus Collierbacteria bacterium RIFOXYB2_FULL_46_14]|nr:MAG: hypothetical protein A3K29_00005 [Candidatus Collierbacteria bacterium RIFOXYB2_FULL_46_14]OGD75566.1 MAG: hypothetical protein A3K43_00005 [Candidatus Collierbacteria bacterium RIFOXYA2_FULL_46_20]OGD76902.1 MAG: hypothetical protein A3K39_00005 [Candidatus Collierbacteria bacterium RIFOXYC2_FULL_43_15]OGD81624.1 MAG: hypothetical protein A3K36_00005 [Candidatus Collierbacteria bacterium RIFOXYD2_FULL_45_13]